MRSIKCLTAVHLIITLLSLVIDSGLFAQAGCPEYLRAFVNGELFEASEVSVPKDKISFGASGMPAERYWIIGEVDWDGHETEDFHSLVLTGCSTTPFVWQKGIYDLGDQDCSDGISFFTLGLVRKTGPISSTGFSINTLSGQLTIEEVETEFISGRFYGRTMQPNPDGDFIEYVIEDAAFRIRTVPGDCPASVGSHILEPNPNDYHIRQFPNPTEGSHLLPF